jgi:hypothetical protein
MVNKHTPQIDFDFLSCWRRIAKIQTTFECDVINVTLRRTVTCDAFPPASCQGGWISSVSFTIEKAPGQYIGYHERETGGEASGDFDELERAKPGNDALSLEHCQPGFRAYTS